MPDAPKRIQRKRTKGWKMEPGAVYVGRGSRWGNPHDWRDWREDWPFPCPSPCLWADETNRDQWCREQATQAFQDDLVSGAIVLPLADLRGRPLACWCAPSAWCHADILLELANAPLRCEAAAP